MKLKKITATVLAVLMVASMASVAASAADINSTNPYEAAAAKLDEVAYTGDDLGATYTPENTTFKVWAPTATDVKINLYTTGSDDEAGAMKIGEEQMVYTAENGLWTVVINGDLSNVYYTYSVTVGGKTNEVCDVYAKSVGVNGDRAMVVDLDSTNPDGWDSDTNFTRVDNQTDANVWELHVKDFSYDASSGVSEANRGKYLAFTEDDTTLNNEGTFKTGTSYIKDVGYNYVQINPFYDFGSVSEGGSDTQFNWGYDPKNYNAPEGSYSSNPYDGNVRVNETKQMIKGVHDQGMGVIMDVVYNHTQSQNSWFQQTVPDYYYRINANGTWSGGSGCGNDTASERAMFRKYIVDSVVYWATEYHIDGFRFDLMGLIDSETMNQVREALNEIDPDIIVYGEGWTMTSTFDTGAKGATQANSASMDANIGFFNDQLRDGVKGSVFEKTGKGFIQGSTSSTGSIINGLQANTNGGNWKALQPTQTVSYDSCHDNATLYDRLVYSMGGEFNDRNENLIQMNKLAASIVFSSQGTSFVLAGEEFARTKLGDENSYVSSPDINKLDWNRTVQYADLVSYYQGMLAFRNYFAPIRTATKSTVQNVSSAANGGVVINEYMNTGDSWNNVVMLYNNQTTAQTVTIPNANADSKWVVVVNKDRAGIQKISEVTGNSVEIAATSALFLVDKTSYDNSGIVSDKGVVKVQHINKATNKVMSEITLTGTYGDAYKAIPSSQFDLYYNVVGDSGNTQGVYSSQDTTVKIYYEENLLTPKDLDGDGKVSVRDTILLQKYIAKLITLTPVQLEAADVNRDGNVTVADVIMYQQHIAQFPDKSGITTVTTNYFDADGKTIADSTVLQIKVGDSYTTTPKTINFYELDSTKLPKNASGKAVIGNTNVNYYYNFHASENTVHVYVPTDQTWVPNLYLWEEPASGTVQDLGAWPGKAMKSDGDGWYSIVVPNGGNYNWIVNSTGGQTADQKGYSGDLWIYMKNATTVDHVNTEGPDA